MAIINYSENWLIYVRHKIIMIDNNNNVIGSVQVSCHKKYKNNTIEELYVQPNYRNKGYGQKLLDSAIEAGRITHNETYLLVEDDSFQMEWYKRNGFEITDKGTDNHTWLKLN